jgi:RHS repeat-associated protein
VGNLTKSEESIGNIVTATTTYKYDDPRSLNTEIIQSGTNLENKRVKFSYDQFGLNTGIERYVNELLTPNSQLSTLNSYDNYGRLKGISHTNSAGVIGESSYEKDLLNRLTSETKDGANRQFNYDKTDQVKGVSGSNNEAYSYDKNGNRVNTGYVTGTGNRLISDGVYSYDYDAEGNRTKRTKIGSGEVEEYTWDYRDRLTSVVKKDASGVVVQTASYEYDIDDQRVSKSVNGVRENYYLDGNQIAFVTDAQGNRTEHYLYGVNVDQVLAQDSPTGMVWSLADRLGSIDTLTDKNGNVVDKRTYDSFGNLLTQTNPNIDFRYGYTGRELDQETGLHYYRARYYDAGVGRFISVDPIGFDAGDSNLYRYVGNSPTMYTDPTGEVAQVLAGAGFGAVFGGLYSLAKNWETGNFNSGSFGRALLGAGSGAVIGAVASSGVGLLAAAATNYFGTAVAGAVVNTAVTAGFTAYGAYSAGGNFGQGRYLTGTLDLIGTGIGAAKVFSGITKGIPGVYQAESDARFNNARQVYQVGDPQLNSTGAIVKSQPSSLATTTSAWGQSNSTSAIVPAATSATPYCYAF